MIIANKADRESDRKISTVTGQQAAKELGTRFAEVSALSGEGVEQVGVA